MPSKIIPNSSASSLSKDASTRKASGTFTGDVYMDAIKPAGEADGIMAAHVTFCPGGRTFWHSHERGQILEVKAGSGWICDKGEKPRRIGVGDLIVCGPGTTHWHGADDGSMMMHLAVSLGKTSWAEEVSGEEYGAKS